MQTVSLMRLKDGTVVELRASGELAEFLTALTKASQTYGIGIAGEPVLFTMETGPESDYERTYKIDAESRLSFD